MAGNHCNYYSFGVLLMAVLWKGQEGIKMGSIVEAAIYEFISIISKFFLIFVIVPAGIIFLGYIIYIIVEVINEIRKK